jgi:hypothetical protein
MTKAAQPKSILIKRDSYKNGNLTNYEFTITSSNHFVTGDKIEIGFPDPVRLTANTKVLGSSGNLQENLDSKVSADLKSIEITISVSARRML